MRCPQCSTTIGIFSSAWQNQRSQEVKHCPACKTPLEVAFRTPRFAFWFAVVAIVVVVLLRALGMPVLLALPVGALAAFNAGLFASMHLRVPRDTAMAVADTVPVRRRPAWLVVGYGVIVVLSFAIFVGGLVVWLRAPWSAAVLLVAGGLCMWKRRVQIASFRIDGLPAQIYAGGLLLAGAWLLVRYLD